MLNEEKVIRMTKLAAFEEREGKADLKIVHFFRGDYIGLQVLKSVIAATFSFVAIFAVYIFYKFEELMSDIYQMDLMEFGRKIIIAYLITVVVYGVLTYIAFSIRYTQAKNHLRVYYSNLKALEKMRDSEEDEEWDEE